MQSRRTSARLYIAREINKNKKNNNEDHSDRSTDSYSTPAENTDTKTSFAEAHKSESFKGPGKKDVLNPRTHSIGSFTSTLSPPHDEAPSFSPVINHPLKFGSGNNQIQKEPNLIVPPNRGEENDKRNLRTTYSLNSLTSTLSPLPSPPPPTQPDGCPLVINHSASHLRPLPPETGPSDSSHRQIPSSDLRTSSHIASHKSARVRRPSARPGGAAAFRRSSASLTTSSATQKDFTAITPSSSPNPYRDAPIAPPVEPQPQLRTLPEAAIMPARPTPVKGKKSRRIVSDNESDAENDSDSSLSSAPPSQPLPPSPKASEPPAKGAAKKKAGRSKKNANAPNEAPDAVERPKIRFTVKSNSNSNSTTAQPTPTPTPTEESTPAPPSPIKKITFKLNPKSNADGSDAKVKGKKKAQKMMEDEGPVAGPSNPDHNEEHRPKKKKMKKDIEAEDELAASNHVQDEEQEEQLQQKTKRGRQKAPGQKRLSTSADPPDTTSDSHAIRNEKTNGKDRPARKKAKVGTLGEDDVSQEGGKEKPKAKKGRLSLHDKQPQKKAKTTSNRNYTSSESESEEDLPKPPKKKGTKSVLVEEEEEKKQTPLESAPAIEGRELSPAGQVKVSPLQPARAAASPKDSISPFSPLPFADGAPSPSKTSRDNPKIVKRRPDDAKKKGSTDTSTVKEREREKDDGGKVGTPLESSGGSKKVEARAKAAAGPSTSGTGNEVKRPVPIKKPMMKTSAGEGGTPLGKTSSGASGIGGLLGNTLAMLQGSTNTPKNKDRDKEKDRDTVTPRAGMGGKKGLWGDEWVMSPDEEKEFAAGKERREAERKKREAWRVDPVNLQEGKDASKVDSMQPRTIAVPAGKGIQTRGAPSEMLRAVLGF